jgi:hypothetical protein
MSLPGNPLYKLLSREEKLVLKEDMEAFGLLTPDIADRPWYNCESCGVTFCAGLGALPGPSQPRCPGWLDDDGITVHNCALQPVVFVRFCIECGCGLEKPTSFFGVLCLRCCRTPTKA